MAPVPTSEILHERLQLEFCPPLDSVLVAALVADLYMDDTVSEAQIDNLCHTLSLLAAQADSDEKRAEKVEDHSGSDSSSTFDHTTTNATSVAPTTDDSPKSTSDTDEALLSDPLAFLQAAFPHVASERLSAALEGIAPEDVDMVSVIENILSEEYLAELEDGGIEEEQAPPKPWRKIVKKRKNGRTVALNDVRQQHHAQGRPSPISTTNAGSAGLDAWTTVASLSARMAALLTPHPDSVFASHFHSPKHPSPAAAARAALAALPPQPAESANMVAELLRDMLATSPELAMLDAEARSQTLDTDTALAARVLEIERLDDALQLVWFLRELDDDAGFGRGMYHAATSPSPSLPASPRPSAALPVHPPDVPPPPGLRRSETVPSKPVTHPNAWNVVPRKLVPGPNPHAAFIPAHNPAPISATARKPVKALKRVEELRSQRADMILRAGRAWSTGNTRNHGGEVAMFYAEQARAMNDELRAAALNDARARVMATRTVSPDGKAGTIDLHFLTVAEAVAVAKESVAELGAPLTIITGKGRHSDGGRSVILPAVRGALVQDGWNVSSFDAGVVVRGRL
ncbi:hypothetical protein PENSPDRAFT_658981 [Peniophora sp. CONT]|nr:hypothetical protein PENSPDRAFT_658981 [Peniophora sp. CONT]